MSRILISNDDGIESPVLVPLARALQRVGDVHTVVPDRERSWIGKAISRFDSLTVGEVADGDLSLLTVNGTPADCVNLALFHLLSQRPDIVVSGINLGLNFGTAFVLSSGTIGAAVEACLAGVPALAFSMALPQDAYGLSGDDRTRRLGDLPLRAAAVAGEVTETVLRMGLPQGVDLLSINMPADVTLETPRRVTPIARTTYVGLFAQDPAGAYHHRIRRYDICGSAPGSDVEVVRAGEVSIAPMRLDLSAKLPDEMVTALERR